MDLRRASQSSERRRRLMNEESALAPSREEFANASPSSTAAPRRARRKERYTPDASWDQQPRITDLIPRGKFTIAGLFLVGVALIVGLEWLYAWMPVVAKSTTDGRIAAFDLDGEGSLGAYFSSLMLFLAACTAFLIYALRRHRLDDYSARYRIWNWAGLCWLVMSIDESGSLHEGFKELMAHVAGSRLYGDGSLWWVMAYGLVLTVIGLRLLWEMRICRASTTAISLSGLSFAIAVVVQLQLVMADRGAAAVMLEEGCEMAGALFLLLAMALHARFIIFDIEGKIKPAATRVAKKSGQAASKSSATAENDTKPESARRERSAERSAETATPHLTRKERKAEAKAEKARQRQERLEEIEQQKSARQKASRDQARDKDSSGPSKSPAKGNRREDDSHETKPSRFRLWGRRRGADQSAEADSQQDETAKNGSTTRNSKTRNSKKAQAQLKPSGNHSRRDEAHVSQKDDDSASENRRLTKAERKALRRERRRKEREHIAD